MSSHTDNLKLFKYDPETDGASTFSLKTALNDNWDRLDAVVAGKADLDPSGKIPAAQLPAMSYDPAGSAAAAPAISVISARPPRLPSRSARRPFRS